MGESPPIDILPTRIFFDSLRLIFAASINLPAPKLCNKNNEAAIYVNRKEWYKHKKRGLLPLFLCCGNFS
jgi:hypothetical protein